MKERGLQKGVSGVKSISTRFTYDIYPHAKNNLNIGLVRLDKSG